MQHTTKQAYGDVTYEEYKVSQLPSTMHIALVFVVLVFFAVDGWYWCSKYGFDSVRDASQNIGVERIKTIA